MRKEFCEGEQDCDSEQFTPGRNVSKHTSSMESLASSVSVSPVTPSVCEQEVFLNPQEIKKISF